MDGQYTVSAPAWWGFGLEGAGLLAAGMGGVVSERFVDDWFRQKDQVGVHSCAIDTEPKRRHYGDQSRIIEITRMDRSNYPEKIPYGGTADGRNWQES